MRARNDAQMSYNCICVLEHCRRSHAECAGFRPSSRALLGISEKQRMFQTYHAAPDDEAAPRMASATRASSSAPWTLGVSG